MLVQGHNVRLLDATRKVGHHQHRGPENQDSQDTLDQASGSFPEKVRPSRRLEVTSSLVCLDGLLENGFRVFSPK